MIGRGLRERAGVTEDVLVMNTGSSSIKYQVVDPRTGSRKAAGLVERVNSADAIAQALGAEPALAQLPLKAVGHRVVHGGREFSGPAVIDDKVAAAIRDLVPLAPLHIPANLAGIEVARRVFPGVPHVAVFDTAFHRTLPPRASTYAVPRAWRERYGVRRYGFHGISYQYVARRAAAYLGRDQPEVNLILLHLGNGASACAVEGGRSVETSMGLTPLEGLVMGTRSGDLDPAVLVYLHREAGLSVDEIDRLLNTESGLKGLTGVNDMREIERRAAAGDEAAADALELYCYRIRKYVGAYAAALGRLDALVFTAGVGENSPEVRLRVCDGLEPLGVRLDPDRNRLRSREARTVSADGGAVAVLVVPTDEELEIAEQTLAAVVAARAR
jgi:acetate kinase